MSLYLIGMRGAGKSTAGALAAARLGVPFVDVDCVIEAQAQASVAEIFQTQGEAGFRALEHRVLLELATRQGELVATGGGAIVQPILRALGQSSRRVVWLTASLEALQARIRGSARPSLTGADPADELAVVLRAREPLYEACASARIDTSALTPSEVSHVIEQLWTDLPHHDLW